MTLVDTWFVGRIGPAALAGVGLGGVLAFMLVHFSVGVLRGVKVLVSQAVGAGRHDSIGAFLGAGFLMAGTLGGATILCAQLVSQVLPWIAATAESGTHAQSYLQIRSFASPAILIYAALREYRYGIGDTRSPLWATVIGNCANVFFDWLFIPVLGWGVTGAAWATVLGHGIEAAFLFAWLAPLGTQLRKARWTHAHSIWRLGFPIGTQSVLEVGAFAVLTAMLAAFSEIEAAAHQIAMPVYMFAYLPILGIADAASVLAGQSVGADRTDLVRPTATRALGIAASYAAVWTVVFAAGGSAIARTVTSDPSLNTIVVHVFWVAAGFQVLEAFRAVARGVLQGTGDVRYPAVFCILTGWVITPPLTWFFGYELAWGAVGGWLALGAEIAVGAVVLWFRVHLGGWLSAAQHNRAVLKATA